MTFSAADLPVRRLDLTDLTACLDLADSRDWTREEHKWRLLLTAGQGYGIDAPAGDRAGGLIATVVVTAYGDRHRCLSMVLVAERYARRGIARHLMRHALAECGPVTVFLSATDQGRPLYEQLGFKAVGTVTTIRGTFTGAVPPPAGAASTVRPATAADLPAVLAYDGPVFGTDRTALLTRLPAFADRFLVAEDAATGRLTGFAAAWPNPSSIVIGPVVADDTATAQALIARLGAEAPRAIRYDVDARHPELDRWLRANGLTGDRPCALMVLGAPDIPGDITRRFAPYSVALG
ncbi:GNAT family N-acetyltransferase [Streptomyces sp. 8K308]|uniref:GNAT family N-acetyltransferase n=1 Tax=Streptomyces sp. 8K308 TaxID=2530388 RepID=UPI00104AC410|nr:GNAT family N-acetyltransferase [Streptomyces sp. 8K308]TDC20781.1 GNAT family N-acetyltransferase [Streptomyces sp. 8K308]